MIFIIPPWFGEKCVKQIFRRVVLWVKVRSVQDGRCFTIFYLCQVGLNNGEILFLMEQ